MPHSWPVAKANAACQFSNVAVGLLLTHTVSHRDKNSSGDEIANVNFYAVRTGSYANSLK